MMTHTENPCYPPGTMPGERSPTTPEPSTAPAPLPPELDEALERLAWAIVRNLADRYRRTGTVVPPMDPAVSAELQRRPRYRPNRHP